MRFLLDPADHNQRFAKISLGVARCVVQRDKHLPPPALLIAHVICIGLDLIGQVSDLGVVLRASDRSDQQAAGMAWLC